MIKILRSSCPACLDTSKKVLVASAYSQDEVINELLRMQHFKCCFCEKDLTKLGTSACWVEHFIPKDDKCFKDASGETDWNRANCWTNLLYSCSTCNRSKGREKPFDDVSGKRRLIDPSYNRIDPEDHIDFIIDDVIIFYKEKNHSKLGKNTIRNLKLENRNDIYAILRKTKLEIDSLFGDTVNALMDGNTIEADAKINEISRKTSAQKPHAAFCRKYIQQKISIFNNNHLRQLNRYCGKHITPLSIPIAKEIEINI